MGEFDAFFSEHARPIWNYLRRLTGDPERAADLFQRSFLKAWTHFEGRTPGRERSWIFTIAVNQARDEMRRRKRDLLHALPAETLRNRAASPAMPAEDRELLREVMRGLDELPSHQRELFLLVRYHGFTFAEAAAVADVGISAAKMAVSRAHEKLIRILSGRLHLGSML
ncbi:MAG TPA: RNA polymerase sigma factor [Planctomycetota bacterium]|jgi:RNA polymerase sigma-70 factor (ECF subfamily)|nr:RNA polymerase sigma factor [Planctomycetota bacterium]